MHRHGCDLWMPPAPSSYRNVYREDPNFPTQSPRERISESMDEGLGVRGGKVDSAACPPQSAVWSMNEEQENVRGSYLSYLLLDV